MKSLYMSGLGILLVAFAMQASAQFSGTFDKAYAMGKGIAELAPVFTNTSSPESDFDNGIGAAGIRIGYGFSKGFDLKVRYERYFSTSGNGDGGFNSLSLEPKLSFAKQKMALRWPVTLWFAEGATQFITSPQLMYTFLGKKNKIDITPSIRTDLLFEDETVYTTLGFALGAGFSSDLSKWAIRPEIGYSIEPEYPEIGYLNLGIAASFYLRGKAPGKN